MLIFIQITRAKIGGIEMFDVVIIGGGIIGASIFRELTKYDVKVVLLEKELDVAMGTSKANSAIVHAGYDPKQGTLMAKYNVRGSELFEELCKELSVPYKRNGSLIIGFEEEDEKTLQALYENGLKNNVKGLQLLSREEVLAKEPHLSEEVRAGLYAPTGAIVGPFEYTIALVENGVMNGGSLKTNAPVTGISKEEEVFRIQIDNGREYITGKYVINAAGLFADQIHNMICEPSYTIRPRRGQYFVLDKSQGSLVKTTIFQCPSKKGKGVLVTPTVHGNLLVGPDSEDLEDREDLSVTREGLEEIRHIASRTSKKINYRENIRNFSGLRALSDREDFIVEEDKKVKGFFDVAGMKSPGLSSAPAIALDVVGMLSQGGLRLEAKQDFNPYRKQTRFMELSRAEKQQLIKQDSRYGRIICRCESITEGEIVASIHAPAGATTVDGVKRRCRPGMGRCQGGFCGPKIQEILGRELHKPMEEIKLDHKDSYLLTGKTK